MISRFSVKKPYTVVVAVILVIILGIVSFSDMTVDLLPSMNMPYAIVSTTYIGASPETVEETVTKPVESAMATISNIKNVSSVSQENASIVMLEFEQTANMDTATIEMRESIDQLASYWPDGVGNSVIMRINPDMLPVMVAAVSVEGQEITKASKIIEENILPELERIEGVASITTAGSVEESIEVAVDEALVKQYNKKIKKHLDAEFTKAEDAIKKAKAKVKSGKKALEAAQKKAATELGNAQAQIAKSEAEINQGLLEIKEKRAELEKTETELNAKLDSLQPMWEYLDEKTKTELTAAKEQIAQGKVTLDTTEEQLKKGAITLAEARGTLTSKSITAILEMDAANIKIALGEQALEDKTSEFTDTKEKAYASADLSEILTVDTIKTILAAQNFNMPAGYVSEDNVKYLIRVGDKIQSVQDLKELVLLDMDGIDPITLSDVAHVRMVDDSDETYAKLNGQAGMTLSIQKQTGYSTGDVSRKLLDKMEELEGKYEGIQLVTLMDQGVYIDLIVDSVLENLLMGAALAILILFLFLRDIRPTIVIACSIPISLLAAIVLMYFSGVTLNIISLSGLALGVGMLVDNSIVVIENIYRMRNEEGVPAKEAAIEGAKQVAGAIASSTLTTVCVFAPIVFVKGITRQLFVDMGLTIAYSLLASLVIALTLVPMMASGVLRKAENKEGRFFKALQSSYGRLLSVALKHKGIVLIGSLVIFVLSGIMSLSKGTAFMPDMESNQLSMTLTTEKGTSFEDTTKAADEVMEILLQIPDIEDVGAMAGGSVLSSLSGSSDSISIYAILKDDPELTNAQLQKKIEKDTKDVPCKLDISMTNMDLSALGSSGIVIQIEGTDLDVLQQTARDIAQLVENVDGTIDISDGMDETTGELRVIVDKKNAAKYNMTVAQVYQKIAEKLQEGSASTTVSTSEGDYGVYVVDENKNTMSRDEIRNMSIEVTNQDGTTKNVKLSKLADFEEATGLPAIRRDAQKRYLQVTAQVAEGKNVGLVSEKVEKALKEYKVPDGCTVEMAGENETIMEAMTELMKMLLLAVVFMYLIMVAQFQSLKSPFIIMFTIPLAFTGGFLGLWIADMPVSVISVIGFVMLAGIIVNNGIVFVDYANQLTESGKDIRAALIETGKTRLRPIIMTALTTILGLLTMAIGVGEGADMVQPMAIVTVGGLIYGTILTLFVVPCIYAIFNRRKSQIKK